MALGGGGFTGQSKALPGAYVNFVSLARVGDAFADRGAVAFAFEGDWQAEGEVVTVTSGEFIKKAASVFGYDYSRDEVRWVREIFRNAETLYAYRLGNGGVKASCAFGTAKYAGTRGNDLIVVISEDGGKFTVTTLLGGVKADEQTVSGASELRENGYVDWNGGATLTATAGTAFSGGANGEASFSDYQAFLEKIASYPVNAVGVCSEDRAVNAMFAEYARNMREKVGVKLQCVVYNYAADYEGVINVKNPVIGDNKASLVYWVAGLAAGSAINKSALNKVYDGEYEVFADYTQAALESAIAAGNFTLHKVGNELRVLADINSLVTVSDEKGYAFGDNQTIRVIDQIACDIAALFNKKYLGNVANDESGRISLWADIVKHHEQLARIRAIESFNDSDVEVLRGEDKRSVVVNDKITVVNAMAQIYMTCVIM